MMVSMVILIMMVSMVILIMMVSMVILIMMVSMVILIIFIVGIRREVLLPFILPPAKDGQK